MSGNRHEVPSWALLLLSEGRVNPRTMTNLSRNYRYANNYTKLRILSL